MGAFPLLLLTGCLNAFRWMLWTVAVLLLILLVVQKVRGDADVHALPEVLAIGAFLVSGLISGWVARHLQGLAAQLDEVRASDAVNPMAQVRRTIDGLDDELVRLLALRQKQIERAAVLKPELGIPARVPDRIDEVLARVDAAAKREGLAPEVAREIWHGLIEWSIAHEEKLMGRKA